MDVYNYYLDDKGLIRLLKELSNKINIHTSNAIIKIHKQDGTTEVINPDNFTTVKAIVDYLQNRANLVINQQYLSEETGEYETATKRYNGEEETQINLNLITQEDINNLTW